MIGRLGLRVAAGAAAGAAVALGIRALRGPLGAATSGLPETLGNATNGLREKAGAAASAVREKLGTAATSLPSTEERRTYLRGVTINRRPEEVYGFWSDFEELSRAVDRLIRVEHIGEALSRWVVTGPGGRELAFVVEVVSDEPERLIAWRTTDSPVPHEGRVEFNAAPGGRGTEVRVRLSYSPPGGEAGALVAKLTGDEPDLLLRDALRRVKQIMEAGEVITVDGQASGRGPVPERVTEAIRHKVMVGGRA